MEQGRDFRQLGVHKVDIPISTGSCESQMFWVHIPDSNFSPLSRHIPSQIPPLKANKCFCPLVLVRSRLIPTHYFHRIATSLLLRCRPHTHSK